MGGERREAEGERRDVGGKSLSPVMKINNLLRDHTGQAQAIAFGRIFKPKKKRPDIWPDNRINFKLSPVL